MIKKDELRSFKPFKPIRNEIDISETKVCRSESSSSSSTTSDENLETAIRIDAAPFLFPSTNGKNKSDIATSDKIIHVSNFLCQYNFFFVFAKNHTGQT